MVLNMRVNIFKGKNMERENILGLMVVIMMVLGFII